MTIYEILGLHTYIICFSYIVIKIYTCIYINNENFKICISIRMIFFLDIFIEIIKNLNNEKSQLIFLIINTIRMLCVTF